MRRSVLPSLFALAAIGLSLAPAAAQSPSPRSPSPRSPLLRSPEPPRSATVGEVRVDGLAGECMYGRLMGPCDWLARAGLRIRTGALPTRVRLLGLEISRDFRAPRRFRPIAVRQIQVGLQPPQRAGRALSIPAGADVEIGLLHGRLHFGDGASYRVRLEVDGRPITLLASESLVVEHPAE